MNAFIALSDKRRRLICEQGQSRMGLPAASLEKDFWVCWTLKQLFELENWGQHLTFKGGTSLSKGWGLIDRFSEDIDIVNEPADNPIIHPYLFDVFPDVLGPSDFPVRSLSPERTFWEKVMLLHEETYRPKGKKRQKARLARHYYDLWCLILRGIAEKAVRREDVFRRTVVHREIYFKWNWMDYTTLKKGSLGIIPSTDDLIDWRKDYRAMSDEMFFGEVPDFDEIIRVIGDFEDSFNSPDP